MNSTANCREDQAHDAGEDIDPRGTDARSDPGRQAQHPPDHQPQQRNTQRDDRIMDNPGRFVRRQYHAADGTGAGQQRHGQRHDGDGVLFDRLVRLFIGLPDRTGFGVQHGDGHQQNQNAAAHPEGRNGDAEKRQHQITEKQRRQQDDDHPDGHSVDGLFALCAVLLRRHADKDGNRPEWVDDRQQADEDFYVFCVIEHMVHLRGKSFRQQRPDGFLVSHAHNPCFVCATTKLRISGSFRASALVTPKQ